MNFISEIKIKGLKELEQFAEKLCQKIKKGAIVGLIGDLGAGKTQFVKYMVKHLGGEPDEVVSPTFTILNEYATISGKVYHFDLYRLNSIDELEEIGYKDFFFGEEIVFIEWINTVREVSNVSDYNIFIEICGENERMIKVKSTEAK